MTSVRVENAWGEIARGKFPVAKSYGPGSEPITMESFPFQPSLYPFKDYKDTRKQIILIGVLNNDFEETGDAKSGKFHSIVIETGYRPTKNYIVFSAIRMFTEAANDLDKWGKKDILLRAGGFSLIEPKFTERGFIEAPSTDEISPVMAVDNGDFYACLFKVGCYPVVGPEPQKFDFYFPVRIDKKDPVFSNKTGPIGSKEWEITRMIQNAQQPGFRVTVGDLFSALAVTPKNGKPVVSPPVQTVPATSSGPKTLAVSPSSASWAPRSDEPEYGTLAYKMQNLRTNLPQALAASPSQQPPPSATFTISDPFVTTVVTVDPSVWNQIVVLYEDRLNDFRVGHLLELYGRRTLGQTQVSGISFHALVRAARETGNFAPIGPAWVRKDMMNDVKYLPAGLIELLGTPIDTRPWNDMERADAQAGAKRMRSNAKKW